MRLAPLQGSCRRGDEHVGHDEGKAKPVRQDEPKRSRDDGPGDREDDKEALDSQLDEELEESFPASDPPSLTQDPK